MYILHESNFTLLFEKFTSVVETSKLFIADLAWNLKEYNPFTVSHSNNTLLKFKFKPEILI